MSEEEKRNFEDVMNDIEEISRIRGKKRIQDVTGSQHASEGFGLFFDSLGLFGTESMINRILRESKERRQKDEKH